MTFEGLYAIKPRNTSKPISYEFSKEPKPLATYSSYTAVNQLEEMHLQKVAKFIYLCGNISSTESNVNIRICKLWTAIGRLTMDINDAFILSVWSIRWNKTIK